MKQFLSILGRIVKFIFYLVFTILEFTCNLLTNIFRSLRAACDSK